MQFLSQEGRPPNSLFMKHMTLCLCEQGWEKIAFASDRYGNFDVFVMSAREVLPQRLTYHSNDEMPYSFSADNQSVSFGRCTSDLAEHRQYPTGSQPELYQVPVKGGRVDQVWTIPAEYTFRSTRMAKR